MVRFVTSCRIVSFGGRSFEDERGVRAICEKFSCIRNPDKWRTCTGVLKAVMEESSPVGRPFTGCNGHKSLEASHIAGAVLALLVTCKSCCLLAM